MPLDLYEIVKSDLAQNGYHPSSIEADGKIHRFKLEASDKGTDAFYVCFFNKTKDGTEFFAGCYGDWKHDSWKTFCTHISISASEKEIIYKRAEKVFEKAQSEKWEETSLASLEYWNIAAESGLHPYLVRKKIDQLHGARLSGDELLIPVMDFDGKMWGFQKIFADGKKLFHPGTKKGGNFFGLGSISPTETIYLCEGFATGVSIYEAIERPVLVCFDAGNLVKVAAAVRSLYPDCLLVVCGDDDIFTDGNPGKTKGEEAANAGLGVSVFPKFRSRSENQTDFNDLAISEGLEALREQILGVDCKRFYVKCLGFQDSAFFYTSSDNFQVSYLSSHSEPDLLRLMPFDYWKSKYPNKKGGVIWNEARSDLMQSCRSRGIFNRSMIRGNGLWIDDGRVIVHLGDRLFYEGKNHSLHSLDSKYIYELDRALPNVEEESISDEELEDFRSLLMSFNYPSYQQAFFLGGWMALAPICGALPWRPHIWLTGEPGSGKTTLKSCIEDYLKSAFRGLFVTGSTTEAGVRQSLKASAFPLVFDEFEPEKKKDRERIDGIMDLIRQASSEQDGEIIKGSAGGSPNSYSTRFMAAVSSVKPRLVAEADKSRFTYIELIKDENSTRAWPDIQKQMAMVTPEFSRKLFARSLHNIQTTLKNIKTFQKAFVSLGNPQRVGQQYGTLMAGYHILESTSEISIADATARAEMVSIESEDSVSSLRDQESCIDFLLGSQISYDNVRFTLAHFIFDNQQHSKLEEYRMRLIDGDLWIAVNNPRVDSLFANSKWDQAWKHVLKRLEGVNPRKVAKLKGRSMMGILIPRMYIQDESEEDESLIELAKTHLNA